VNVRELVLFREYGEEAGRMSRELVLK